MPRQPSSRPSRSRNRPQSMLFRAWEALALCRTTLSRCGCVTPPQWSSTMINFTLSKAQEEFRAYAHQVALEEMRPISLECDRTEKIPESFFLNMQQRFWAGSAGQARRMEAQEEGRQQAVLGVLSHEEQARFLAPYMDGKLHWGALALTEPGIGSDVAGMSTTAALDGDEWVINGHKHYITNGARADLVVTFATVDKSLGR